MDIDPGERKIADVDSDEEAVRRANHAFYRAFETLEVARMDEAWWHDGQITCVHPGWPLATGWDEVRRTWRTIFDHADGIRFEISDERIDVRGDLAWVVCVEWIRGPEPLRVEDPTAAERSAALATNVLVRREGTWRMVHHHASALVVKRADRPRAPAASRGAAN